MLSCLPFSSLSLSLSRPSLLRSCLCLSIYLFLSLVFSRLSFTLSLTPTLSPSLSLSRKFVSNIISDINSLLLVCFLTIALSPCHVLSLALTIALRRLSFSRFILSHTYCGNDDDERERERVRNWQKSWRDSKCQ